MMEQMNTSLLKIEGLFKSFAGLMAVKDLSFTVIEGEILGLIGPNGSGKTTAFNLISGFLKPDEGRIKFKGKDITGLKPHRICGTGITRTFQLVKPFAEMTALQNVVAGRTYGCKPISSLEQARAEAEEILVFTGLSRKKSGRPSERIQIGKQILDLIVGEISEGRHVPEGSAKLAYDVLRGCGPLAYRKIRVLQKVLMSGPDNLIVTGWIMA